MLAFVVTTLRFNFNNPPSDPPTSLRFPSVISPEGLLGELVRQALLHPFMAEGAHVSPLRENGINPRVGVCIRPFHFSWPVSRVRGAL